MLDCEVLNWYKVVPMRLDREFSTRKVLERDFCENRSAVRGSKQALPRKQDIQDTSQKRLVRRGIARMARDC